MNVHWQEFSTQRVRSLWLDNSFLALTGWKIGGYRTWLHLLGARRVYSLLEHIMSEWPIPAPIRLFKLWSTPFSEALQYWATKQEWCHYTDQPQFNSKNVGQASSVSLITPIANKYILVKREFTPSTMLYTFCMLIFDNFMIPKDHHGIGAGKFTRWIVNHNFK